MILSWRGMLVECDVKQLAMNGGGYYGFSRSAGKLLKTPVGVHPITKEIRWHKKRTPPGWENFWD